MTFSLQRSPSFYRRLTTFSIIGCFRVFALASEMQNTLRHKTAINIVKNFFMFVGFIMFCNRKNNELSPNIQMFKWFNVICCWLFQLYSSNLFWKITITLLSNDVFSYTEQRADNCKRKLIILNWLGGPWKWWLSLIFVVFFAEKE